jgi:transcriptional regulator with XRE-family HTH domain
MDDRRLGAAIRAIRLRLGLTQEELGIASRTSRHVVGRIERRRLCGIDLPTIHAVAASLDADLDVVVRWRGGDLGRLVSARHAALHEAIAQRFAELNSWTFEPEVSFSSFGERGVIDGLAWHPNSATLLVVELKTEIVDVNDLMASMDRRVRLAREIGAQRSWDPRSIACWVAIADSRTNRRAVSRHRRVLRAKFPDDGRRARGWLLAPSGALRALGFVPVEHFARTGAAVAGARRVGRTRSRSSPAPNSNN